MRVGTHVEVRNRFDARWSRGFEVAEELPVGREPRPGEPPVDGGAQYRVRRRSDGTVLPAVFDAADLRAERRRSTWWL